MHSFLWHSRGALRIFLSSILLMFAINCGGSSSSLQVADKPALAVVEPILPNQLASFDYVWDAIDGSHWDPEKVGASWDAARAQLRPKMVAATTVQEASEILEELLARLGQSHFQILGGSAQSSEDGGGGNGSLGMEVRLIDDAVVVWRVDEKGPAAAQGIATGMIIDVVNDKAWKDVLAKQRSSSGSSSHGSYQEQLAPSLYIRGPVGEPAMLSLRDGKGQKREVTMAWVAPPGTLASYGLLTNIPVEYDSHEIGDVGYVRLSVFFDPVMVSQRFKADVALFAKKRGLVFDLRGNPGGIGGMAMGLGGQLVSEKGGKLGTMISRDSRMNFVLNPQPGAYTGKLAILVDGQCASTCEILAAGLADIGRAHVFGTRTAGAALPSQIEELPNGMLLQYATANYISSSGRALEKEGLTPETIVPLTRKSLLAGSDSQLAAALSWIHSK